MEPLDEAGWRNLERLENGVTLDIRYDRQWAQLPTFIELYQRGYCTLQETGPGGSVHIFRITPAGKAALAAHRGGG